MRHLAAVAALLWMASSVSAGEDAHGKLVADYIKAVRAEQLITAEVEASIQQYSVNASPEQKVQIERYFNAAMGWGAIKDQYAALVQRTYSPEELRAAMAFLKTPVGNAIGAKSVEFSRQLAIMLSKNVQKISQEMADPAESSGTSAAQAEGDLVALNVEEHSSDGKSYFTGIVENRGKKPRRGVQVEVNLFQAGRFVDQYSTYISGIVAPGSQRYFKISCGCKDNPPAPHDSHKILVVEGY